MAPLSSYSDGRRTEWAVIQHLSDHGYQCIRAAGSKGAADIAGFRAGEAVFVSVKRTDPLISPAERVALLDLARTIDGHALVATKPLRQPLAFRRLTGTGPRDYEAWEATT